MRFRDPNPHEIYIGALHLDEYLREAGQASILSLRGVLQELDWSCFEEKYKAGGRPPYAPWLMLGLVLYGIMQGVSSLRTLERLARMDMGCMWMCGGIAPDHSAIGRFLNLHREVLTEQFFEQLTQSVLDKVGSSATEVSGDGTVVQAMASRYRLIALEAAQQAAAEAATAATAAPHDTKVAQRAEDAAKVARIVEERAAARRKKNKDAKKTVVSPTEPEAAYQPLKNRAMAPSYKPSVLANAERIIVGKEVDPTNEIAVVSPMLEQAERIGKQPVERLMLDAGYHCTEVVTLAVELELDLLCPEGQTRGNGSWDKQSKKKFPKNLFRYDEVNDTYICPAEKVLLPLGKRKGTVNTTYGTPECTDCPLRAQCTVRQKPHTKKATGRTIRRYPVDDAKDALRQVMRHPQARQIYKRRQSTVEPVFADLKDRQGLRRFRRRGLLGVRLEFSLHAMAHNLRRFVALASKSTLDRLVACIFALLRAWRCHGAQLAIFAA